MIAKYYIKLASYGDALINGIKSLDTEFFVFLMLMDLNPIEVKGI